MHSGMSDSAWIVVSICASSSASSTSGMPALTSSIVGARLDLRVRVDDDRASSRRP